MQLFVYSFIFKALLFWSNSWFIENCKYRTGIPIYSPLASPNVNILQNLRYVCQTKKLTLEYYQHNYRFIQI